MNFYHAGLLINTQFASRLPAEVFHCNCISDIDLAAVDHYILKSLVPQSSGKPHRCRPGQPLKKPSTLNQEILVDAIEQEFKHSRTVEFEKLSNAVPLLLRSKSVVGCYMGNFRNAAVHGIKVELDKACFFSEQRPYWQPLYSEYYPPFMTLKFSAPFLLTLLRNSLKTL